MQLKMYVLSGSALALWLVPLVGLNEKISWHKTVQGLSLCGALACAVSAGNIARKLAGEAEIETIKERAITADVVDEIATEAFISQEQRQQEAERLLNGEAERSENVELLERALALTSGDGELPDGSENVQLAENADGELRERILQLQARGYGKGKIILEVWGATKGGSPRYKAAEAEYRRLVGE